MDEIRRWVAPDVVATPGGIEWVPGHNRYAAEDERAAAEAPMCSTCGHFFTGDEQSAGKAYAFLYHHDTPLDLDRDDFLEHFEEVVLDMGNDTPDKAVGALAYALTMAGGWPEADDLQAAVLHRLTHGEG